MNRKKIEISYNLVAMEDMNYVHYYIDYWKFVKSTEIPVGSRRSNIY